MYYDEEGAKTGVKKYNGKWKYFYENGKLQYESNFVSGMREGEQLSYKKDGSLEERELYKNGKLISTK